MPPRRSHKKSRAGCRRCKLRKIKCDEIHPQCGNCLKHGVECDFESPELAEKLQARLVAAAGTMAGTAAMGGGMEMATSPSGILFQTSPGSPESPILLDPMTPHPGSSSSAMAFDFTTPFFQTFDASPQALLPPHSPASRASLHSRSLSTSSAVRHYGVRLLGASSPPPQLCRSPSAVSPISGLRSSKGTMELRLMHQYTTDTCTTLAMASPGTRDVWKVRVPSLAFSGAPYLTDALLAVSALHLRTLAVAGGVATDPELVAASHEYIDSSLKGYTRELRKGITTANAEGLFLTASLLTYQSSATLVFQQEHTEHAVALQAFGAAIATNSATPSPQGAPGASMLEMVKLEDGSGPGGHQRHHARRNSSGSGMMFSPTLEDVTAGLGDLGEPLDFNTPPTHGNGRNRSAAADDSEALVERSAYKVPVSILHAFHGVKAVTASAWFYLRNSETVANIINSQPMLWGLDLEGDLSATFFGHLLDGLPDELARLDGPDDGLASATRQAYVHAVAVLNWAHSTPHLGAALVLPATVSRRFVELVEQRRPRALTVLACFFALLRRLDDAWWLRGVARREVLGLAGHVLLSTGPNDPGSPSSATRPADAPADAGAATAAAAAVAAVAAVSDSFSAASSSSSGSRPSSPARSLKLRRSGSPQDEGSAAAAAAAAADSAWLPKLAWAMRVALYDGSGTSIPPEVWGAEVAWPDDGEAAAEAAARIALEQQQQQQEYLRQQQQQHQQQGTFVDHVEVLSRMISALQSIPPPTGMEVL